MTLGAATGEPLSLARQETYVKLLQWLAAARPLLYG
jgi:hypothetical protein